MRLLLVQSALKLDNNLSLRKRQWFKYRKQAIKALLALTFIIMLFAPAVPALAKEVAGNRMAECVTLRVMVWT